MMHFIMLLPFYFIFHLLIVFLYYRNGNQEGDEDIQKDPPTQDQEFEAETTNTGVVDQGKPRCMLPPFYKFLFCSRKIIARMIDFACCIRFI